MKNRKAVGPDGIPVETGPYYRLGCLGFSLGCQILKGGKF